MVETLDAMLRRYLVAAEMTEEALAERLGCSLSAVRHYLSGRRRPRHLAPVLDALAIHGGDRDVAYRLADAPKQAAP